jgi:hypothetical protein
LDLTTDGAADVTTHGIVAAIMGMDIPIMVMAAHTGQDTIKDFTMGTTQVAVDTIPEVDTIREKAIHPAITMDQEIREEAQ